MWYLYILFSDSISKFYIGISNDMQQRLEFHNRLGHGFTKSGRPWKLVWSKEFLTREEAAYWESFIKKQKSHSIIEKVITGNFKFDNS